MFTLNEKRLYQINYFDTVYNTIPDYTLSETETYSVYIRTVIPLAGNRRNTDISIFKNSDSEYYKIRQASFSVLITSVFYLILVGIVYTIFSILNILSKRYIFKQFLFDLNPELE